MLKERFVKKQIFENSIKVLVLPKGIQTLEDERTVAITWGKALGIPTRDNPTTGKPIFFVREEVLYTSVFFHELGHVLGLWHTFHGDDQDEEGLNCFFGDYAYDTYTPPSDIQYGHNDCNCYTEEELTQEKIRSYLNALGYPPPHCMEWEITEGQFRITRKVHSVNSLLQEAAYRKHRDGPVNEYKVYTYAKAQKFWNI